MFNKSKTSESELSSQSNFLSQATEIKGNINTHGNFRLEGSVIGNVECTAKFISSETSKIQGNVYATNAEISGEVIGDLEVKELLCLKSTARIKGNINSNKLMVEPGASIDGNFKTNQTISEPLNSIKKPSEKVLA
jgi:cytoskeletal protein CcmA (bactofilin family)